MNASTDCPSVQQRQVLKLFEGLRVPVLAAPMFLVSGPQLLTACCRAGILGSLPAPNARTLEQLDQWLGQIAGELAEVRQTGGPVAPWMLNMIVHSSYDRFAGELELVRRYRPPVVSTALGSPKRVLDEVHAYGGAVLADVISPVMARKAAEAGVDGLILVCNGAGGHTGSYNPFAFVAEVRRFWKGPLGLAGAVSSGRDIHAARVLGCDFVVVGTRLIAAEESLVEDAYRQMLIDCSMDDLVATRAVSGVLANWMKPSLERAGIDPAAESRAAIDFSGDIASANKAWKHVWSAGQGVGQIERVYSVAELVEELEQGYRASRERAF
ncbi:2-nitropropane dioxygenase-like dioxygenase [Azotobacter vinelandii CA]|uniref:2-nitropropane dioxygenase-like dioxygenase n=2 Tax=Azotobacter vinelandii TaxID=354 RepID=C1DF14_AZOVD|nr:nitronate monooxygenase [Azotobacter vinelandii]ACO80343.1 2-nitropropane dioxygenase-like dioxygenase [Azotobacter vinelandii DJ]AGK16022.1 2-nitropropane dioxygenase-like dioxygenase [Azotobacter vinelandii CA]AGK21869.1 2-nitropropane dioxygenase-like dioxygenase [Azotobacter vinelandii CA6]WKN21128.1 nitronate monooxygenase [Azotobacter vinelandii]SFY26418.1 nitronate monooxygenase [Azotobacter vinelandii]